MPIQVEQLPGESIVSATVTEPFNPEQDMPAMFEKYIPMRMKIQGPVVLIIDTTSMANKPGEFSQMVFALAKASEGVKASKSIGVAQPPITIFVGSGRIADIASQAMEQEQYGGVRGHLCATYEEALVLAREKLRATP